MMPDSKSKDQTITDLIAQAEKLVTDLNATVTDMKTILATASENVQVVKDAQRK
jgi:hypothetical protein